MKDFKRVVWLLCAMFCLMTFVACEEDKTEDFYTIRMGEVSDAYKGNYLLQVCVNGTLSGFSLDTPGPVLRTEKEAKEWFDGACNSVKNSWTLMNSLITIEPDTWVELQLLNSNNAIVKSKKVKFEEKN